MSALVLMDGYRNPTDGLCLKTKEPPDDICFLNS